MLSAADLAGMRATQELTLTETAVVRRPVLTSDGAGGQTETSTITVATVACRVAPSRGPVEQVLVERMAAVQGWTVTLPYGTYVRATDRLIVGSRTFEVIGVIDGETYETARRCVCVEMT